MLSAADGVLANSSLTSLIQRKPRVTSGKTSLAGVITKIHVVQLTKTKNRWIIVGADDGSISIFTFQYVYEAVVPYVLPLTLIRSLQLIARWTVFIEPLKEVIHVPAGRLQDCVFCVSQDGSIAVIAPDGCELYVIRF